jgi:protein-disulfide isomerase
MGYHNAMTTDRRFQIWAAAIFIIVIIAITVIAAFASGGAQTLPSGFQATQTSPIAASDWARGTTGAGVTLIEYGDFQCPACGAYEPLVEQIQSEYAGKLLFVFRNFPLYQIHPNAMIAAQAAEAAGVQGKYWEMHDLLYQKQNDWATAANSEVVAKFFDGYAQSIGIDVKKFDTDINSAAVKAKVQADMNSGNAAAVDHTPTFFVNLTQIPNPNSLAEFKAAIDAALASSTAQ